MKKVIIKEVRKGWGKSKGTKKFYGVINIPEEWIGKVVLIQKATQREIKKHGIYKNPRNKK